MSKKFLKKTVYLAALLALLIPATIATAGHAADSSRTFRGTYDWFDGGSGPLSAEFEPDGDGEWKVRFRFEFSKNQNTWKGAAQGSLEEGSKITGTASWKGRNWVFDAMLEDGTLRGTHTEIRKDNSKYETGTFKLAK